MRATPGAAVLFLGAFLPVACSGQANMGPIIVGHVTPLSGKDKLSGKHAEQGITLAVEEANRDGGFPDGRSVNVLHADDQGDAEKAQAEAVRLITLNKAAALVGGVDAVRTGRVARAAKSYDVAVVAPEGVAAGEGSDHTLSLDVTPSRQGRVLAGYVVGGLGPGVRCLIVLADDSEAGRARADAFAAELKPHNHPVEQKVLKTAADLPALVDVVKDYDKGGAVLLVGADPATVGNLRTNHRILTAQIAWLYAGTEEQIDAMRADRRASRDLCLATAFLETMASDKGKTFFQDYRKRFSEDPDAHAMFAYESTRLLCDALRRARSADPSRVREELMRTETFEGVMGTITFGPDRAVRRPLFVLKLMDNGPFMIYKAPAEEK